MMATLTSKTVSTKEMTLAQVDELFTDWHEGNIKRLKHHNIPLRVYTKDIAPAIGQMQPAA